MENDWISNDAEERVYIISKEGAEGDEELVAKVTI